mmetsp:Transcript_68245/g.146059  ORF Transcript_68245/g.146059 Transcript_68245/m.146059 type:complete len:258 (+) Transcript_68245:3-776(+)
MPRRGCSHPAGSGGRASSSHFEACSEACSHPSRRGGGRARRHGAAAGPYWEAARGPFLQIAQSLRHFPQRLYRCQGLHPQTQHRSLRCHHPGTLRHCLRQCGHWCSRRRGAQNHPGRAHNHCGRGPCRHFGSGFGSGSARDLRRRGRRHCRAQGTSDRRQGLAPSEEAKDGERAGSRIAGPPKHAPGAVAALPGSFPRPSRRGGVRPQQGPQQGSGQAAAPRKRWPAHQGSTGSQERDVANRRGAREVGHRLGRSPS